MAKKNNKSKGLQHKKQKPSRCQPSSSGELPVAEPVVGAPEPEKAPELQLKTLVGVIDTELYERLFKPALMSFGLRRDDEPLRQLVESIVTAIAMSEAYEGCRKLDDICQRYLYYLESLEGAQPKSWEAAELNALTDYWRLQVVMTLIRDSAAIFGLLLPEAQAALPTPVSFEQETFLASVKLALGMTLDGPHFATRDTALNRDLYDFVHGVSFPWLGFPSESVFPLQNHVHDADRLTEHPFALANAEQTKIFAAAVEQAIHECLFLDLMAAQHKKIFEDICMAFEPSERLSEDFQSQLSQRIKFDKIYQTAFNNLLSGHILTKDLHRASRLPVDALNAFGQFAAIVRKAAELNLGIYVFHYVG